MIYPCLLSFEGDYHCSIMVLAEWSEALSTIWWFLFSIQIFECLIWNFRWNHSLLTFFFTINSLIHPRVLKVNVKCRLSRVSIQFWKQINSVISAKFVRRIWFQMRGKTDYRTLLPLKCAFELFLSLKLLNDLQGKKDEVLT